MPDRPKMSVIINCFNMARELPRTLKSLSAPMQKGLHAWEYELIVVDNGSTKPVDRDYCTSIADNIFFLDVDQPTASPCKAINMGLANARGDLILVMIDGARMASPGLLRTCFDATKFGPRAIAGSIGFHLGWEVQMKAVLNGYNQAVEDKLLSTVPWEDDGYRLFDIAVLAGSSAKGWFKLPVESNAICMHKDIWHELGGYDIAYKEPGGGLANHDIWKRACELPNSLVIMLLGEATFHQFHGGIATNSAKSKLNAFHAEYKKIRGVPYAPPDTDFLHYGKLEPGMLQK